MPLAFASNSAASARAKNGSACSPGSSSATPPENARRAPANESCSRALAWRRSKRLQCVGGGGLGQDDGKLVAADAAGNVRDANKTRQSSAELRQNRITGEVSGSIVDELEIVHVRYQERDLAVVAVGPCYLAGQGLRETRCCAATGSARRPRLAARRPGTAPHWRSALQSRERAPRPARRPRSRAYGRSTTPVQRKKAEGDVVAVEQVEREPGSNRIGSWGST